MKCNCTIYLSKLAHLSVSSIHNSEKCEYLFVHIQTQETATILVAKIHHVGLLCGECVFIYLKIKYLLNVQLS